VQCAKNNQVKKLKDCFSNGYDLSQVISITIFSESGTYELYRKILKISDHICFHSYFRSRSNSSVIALPSRYMRCYIYFTFDFNEFVMEIRAVILHIDHLSQRRYNYIFLINNVIFQLKRFNREIRPCSTIKSLCPFLMSVRTRNILIMPVLQIFANARIFPFAKNL